MNEIFKLEDDFYVLMANNGPVVWGTLSTIKAQLLEEAIIHFEEEFNIRMERVYRNGRSSIIRNSIDPEELMTLDPGILVPFRSLQEALESYDPDTDSFITVSYPHNKEN